MYYDTRLANSNLPAKQRRTRSTASYTLTSTLSFAKSRRSVSKKRFEKGGYTYEKAAILDYIYKCQKLKENPKSPVTGCDILDFVFENNVLM